MADRRRIVEQWKRGAAEVLVTLVRAEGSSYRRPGAHLLIGADGEYAGTISGGCLEAEVVRKASWMVRDGAMVERYSTLFDDTAEIPFGLGCGGVVDLLLEPVKTPECQALLEAMEVSLCGAGSRVATWLPENGTILQRAVFGASGDVLFRSETSLLPILTAVLSLILIRMIPAFMWNSCLSRSGCLCWARATTRNRWLRWRRCSGGTSRLRMDARN